MTYSTLAKFIYFVIGLAVLIYILVTLRNLNRVIRKINDVTDRNSVSLEKTIAQLPEFTKNLNILASGLGYGIEKMGSVVATVDTALTRTVSVLNSGTTSIIEILSLSKEVVIGLLHKIGSSRRK